MVEVAHCRSFGRSKPTQSCEWLRHSVAASRYLAAPLNQVLYAKMSPTILRQGPYQFFFYSNEGSEPHHIHVRRDDGEAKFWLDPVRVAYSHGFKASELRNIRSIISENREKLIGEWDEFFSK